MTTPLNSYEVVADYNGDPALIGIVFSIGTEPYILTDAIVTPVGSMTQAEIDAEIQRRYNDWFAAIKAAEETPT